MKRLLLTVLGVSLLCSCVSIPAKVIIEQRDGCSPGWQERALKPEVDALIAQGYKSENILCRQDAVIKMTSIEGKGEQGHLVSKKKLLQKLDPARLKPIKKQEVQGDK